MNKLSYPISITFHWRAIFPIALLFLFSSCEYNSIAPPSDLEPTFSNVGPLLQMSCSGGNCHIGQRTSGVRLDSYENIITSVGNQYGQNIVKPGDADVSPIINKISGEPQFGSRMPFGRTPLTDDKIELIRKWINNGAKYD